MTCLAHLILGLVQKVPIQLPKIDCHHYQVFFKNKKVDPIKKYCCILKINDCTFLYLKGDEDDDLDDLQGIAQEYLREKELFDADEKAQAGQNLLSFVEDKPKLYGSDDMFSPRSDRSMGNQRVGQGSALMDFFVDPTQIFASERHPALQEVLAVLSKSKKHRGILENNMHKSPERVFFNRPLILLLC